MGKLLSARKILLGTLTKTGKVLTITAKSVDVETGRIDFAESERCMKEEDLELASKILAVKIVNNIAGTSYTTPLRTYQQDETRNRFAMGMFYRNGVIKNVNVPILKIEPLRFTSTELDYKINSAIISPSYEFTDNFGVRMDFKYIYSESEDRVKTTDNIQFYYSSDKSFNNGYGLAL